MIHKLIVLRRRFSTLTISAAVTTLYLLPCRTAPGQTAPVRAQVMEHYHRAQAALAQGHIETAEGEFRAILSTEPGNVPALANLGALAYKRGNLAEAKTLLQRTLQLDPQLWDAKALLGLTEAGMDENKDALVNLQDAFPHIHDPGVKLDAGMALLNLHQQNDTLLDAAPVAQELERLAPANPEVLYSVYHAYSELAANALERMRNADPNSGRLHEVLAEAALTQDQFPAAIAELRMAISIQPSLPGVHYKLGNTLLLNAQDAPARKEARQAFEAELLHDPKDFRSEYKLGELDQMEGQHAAAEAHYRRALSLHAAYPEAQAAIGNLRAEEQKPQEALPYFLEASRLDPNNETFHYRLARLYQTLNKPEDSRREMEAFRKLHKP